MDKRDLYFYLFNVLTETAEKLEKLKEFLLEAQQTTEEMYMSE